VWEAGRGHKLDECGVTALEHDSRLYCTLFSVTQLHTDHFHSYNIITFWVVLMNVYFSSSSW
jgi:hypothetical protein